MPGPLKGIRVIEMAAIGPATSCAMMLADMGAEVLRVDRVSAADLGLAQSPRSAVLNRNRRSLALAAVCDDVALFAALVLT